MKIRLQTYHEHEGFLRRIDVRMRLLALVFYSAALFVFGSWPALALCATFLAVVFLAGGVPVRSVLFLSLPVCVLAACVVAANAIGFDAAQGVFAFSQEGFELGVFSAVRVVLVVWATLTVCLTASAVQFVDAFRSILSPLRSVRVPVDDVAMVISIALRFVPVVGEELLRIRAAQWARGASFGEGSPLKRIKTWIAVLIPLIAGLFRRSDNLAEAMDARCYGASAARTSLGSSRIR